MPILISMNTINICANSLIIGELRSTEIFSCHYSANPPSIPRAVFAQMWI